MTLTTSSPIWAKRLVGMVRWEFVGQLRLGRRGWPTKFFAADLAVSGPRQIAFLSMPQFRVVVRTGHGRKSQFPPQLEFSGVSVGHG